MYENGYNVPQDYSEALKWYRLAADQGLAEAQFNLGQVYADGHGVLQDYIQAHMWFNIACANGLLSSESDRDRIAAMMSPTDVSEAQRRAKACMASDYKNCD